MNSDKTITATFTPLYDDVVFDSNFENGNLYNAQYVSGDELGNRVYNAEQEHTIVSFDITHWWFHFSMDNVAGKTVKINLINNEPADNKKWVEVEPCYSYDDATWERIDLSGVAFDEVTRIFTMTVTPTENKIYLAPLPPYTNSIRDSLFAEFESSNYFTSETIGVTPGGQAIRAATITDPAYDDAHKLRAYVQAMQHSGEVPGGWESDGMIRFLMSDTPEAQAIRRNYIFRIVPIVNVESVYLGISRYSPIRDGVQYDLNRCWSFDIEDMPFEVATMFNDIDNFNPDSFNDLHSTIGTYFESPKDVITFYGSNDPAVFSFMDSIKAAGYPENYRGGTSYCPGQVYSRLGVLKSISWENPQDGVYYDPDHKLTVNDWRDWGKAYTLGVYRDGGTYVSMLDVDSGLPSPAGDYRWLDVADQEYSAEYRANFNYLQANVEVIYQSVGTSLSGTLRATNLKPNFAYQLKLVGTSGTLSNELIGSVGRWWEEEWTGAAWENGANLNDKGDGSSPNPNDILYQSRRNVLDATSPTGLNYRYTGYIIFDYFTTDKNGDAALSFESGSCHHVIWKTTQRETTDDDGQVKESTFDSDLSHSAYDFDYPGRTVSIYGEWERLPMGQVSLDLGTYDCQLVLTEESFHGSGGSYAGSWAAAMSAPLTFKVTADRAGKFTLVVLPDTQFYSKSYPTIFDSQTRWIASNEEDFDIVFVTHEGDIVNDNVDLQWQRADNSLSILDETTIPWGVLPGNHDLSGGSTNYNTYFGYSRFSGENWYGGAYQNINTNSYQLFTVGLDNYLIFHFQYSPSTQVLFWANETIADYPTRRVIVTTHDYMNVDGSRDSTGETIWNKFVKPHADQVFLVLCGHNHGENRRVDVVGGHSIYQILADYQDRTNGGNGWMRTLEFQPSMDKIIIKTFSPHLNQYELDVDSDFTLIYDMTK